MSSEPPVQEQLARLQRTFRHGWVTSEAGEGGPGERAPFARGLDESDYEFSVEQFEGELCVVLEFSQDEAPGVRFRHRFPPPDPTGEPDYSDVHFMENVETNKLSRSRARVGAEATLVVTDFSWRHPANRLGRVMDLLRQQELAGAASLLRTDGDSGWDFAFADEIETAAAGEPSALAGELERLHVACLQRREEVREADRAMTQLFWETHVRRRFDADDRE